MMWLATGLGEVANCLVATAKNEEHAATVLEEI